MDIWSYYKCCVCVHACMHERKGKTEGVCVCVYCTRYVVTHVVCVCMYVLIQHIHTGLVNYICIENAVSIILHCWKAHSNKSQFTPEYQECILTINNGKSNHYNCELCCMSSTLHERTTFCVFNRKFKV